MHRPTRWEISSNSFVEFFVKPERPIPPVTSAIHHIIDEDVALAPNWEASRGRLLESQTEPVTAFAAHNMRFEALFLASDVVDGRLGVCTYKCALRLWPEAPGHSNQALRYWRKPEGLAREIASVSHRAMADAYVSAFLLRDMLNDGANLDQLIEWTSQPAVLITCHIGKYRGQKWSEVDSGMMYWILDRDFDEDVKHTCRYWLEKRANDQSSNDDGEPF